MDMWKISLNKFKRFKCFTNLTINRKDNINTVKARAAFSPFQSIRLLSLFIFGYKTKYSECNVLNKFGTKQ